MICWRSNHGYSCGAANGFCLLLDSAFTRNDIGLGMLSGFARDVDG